METERYETIRSLEVVQLFVYWDHLTFTYLCFYARISPYCTIRQCNGIPVMCEAITHCNQTNENHQVHIVTKRVVGFPMSQLQNSSSFGAALLSAPV